MAAYSIVSTGQCTAAKDAADVPRPLDRAPTEGDGHSRQIRAIPPSHPSTAAPHSAGGPRYFNSFVTTFHRNAEDDVDSNWGRPGEHLTRALAWPPLADEDVFTKHLDLSEGERLSQHPGAAVRTWARKVRALVDDVFELRRPVVGPAYLMLSREHEGVVQLYETDKYDIVSARSTPWAAG